MGSSKCKTTDADREFYLNVVGCKVDLLDPDSYGDIWFYLNVVGCKASSNQAFHQEYIYQFYLNVVGCKEPSPDTLFISDLSFI